MATYVNRTYDSVAGAFVRWSSASADTTGALYPGPGVFGGTATDYCVEDVLTVAAALADFRNDFITGETVTGTDSVLSTSLTAPSSDGQSVLIIYNRQTLTQGQDFTVSGTAITWLASSGTAPSLVPSDTLFIYYVVDSLAVNIDFLNDLITGETVTGTDSVLSGALSFAPSDSESVLCSYNRQTLSQGQDFTISGTAITWLASSGTAPSLVPSDTLQFYYVVNTTAGGSGTDEDAIHDNVASEISAVTEKVTPISADLILIEDSAAGNAKKRVQIGNLPAASVTMQSAYDGAAAVTLSTVSGTNELIWDGTNAEPAGLGLFAISGAAFANTTYLGGVSSPADSGDPGADIALLAGGGGTSTGAGVAGNASGTIIIGNSAGNSGGNGGPASGAGTVGGTGGNGSGFTISGHTAGDGGAGVSADNGGAAGAGLISLLVGSAGGAGGTGANHASAVGGVGGVGGPLGIRSGAGGAGGASLGLGGPGSGSDGGDLDIFGGNGGAAGTGGVSAATGGSGATVTIRGGQGAVGRNGGTNGNGGAVLIEGGFSASGTDGVVNIGGGNTSSIVSGGGPTSWVHTGAFTATTVNGVAITTAGVSTNFLNEAGTYSAPASGGSGELVAWDITQTSHGLAVSDVVRINTSGDVVKAKADDGGTLGLFVVTEVDGVNDFTLGLTGHYTDSSHGLTVGNYYYLDASTAGALTSTEPTAPNYSNPIIFVEDANTLVIVPWRPSSTDSAAGDVTELVDAVPTFIHPTDQIAVQTSMVDTELEGCMMDIPNDVEFNRLTLSIGASWNTGAANGKLRVCVYQSDDGTMQTTLSKVFDELVSPGDVTISTPYDIPVTGGGTVTLKRGRYFIAVGLDDTTGSALTPYIRNMSVTSIDGYNNNIPSGAVPTTFEDLGAGTAATPPATINPTTLTGAGARNNLVIHRFRKV